MNLCDASRIDKMKKKKLSLALSKILKNFQQFLHSTDTFSFCAQSVRSEFEVPSRRPFWFRKKKYKLSISVNFPSQIALFLCTPREKRQKSTVYFEHQKKSFIGVPLLFLRAEYLITKQQLSRITFVRWQLMTHFGLWF